MLADASYNFVVNAFVEFPRPEMRDAHQKIPVIISECPGMADAFSPGPVNETHITFIDNVLFHRLLHEKPFPERRIPDKRGEKYLVAGVRPAENLLKPFLL